MTALETKLSSDAVTWLHRWECQCGRVGCWLTRPEVAESNGLDHEELDHGVPFTEQVERRKRSRKPFSHAHVEQGAER